jgi:hypothetical protein
METEKPANAFGRAPIGPLLRDPYLWLSLVCAGLLLCFTLWFPIGPDAGMLGYCSWLWEKYNEPPYVGCNTENFPGIFLVQLLGLKLFGGSMLSFRIFDLIIEIASTLMIFSLARRLFQSGLAGFFATLAFASYYYNLGYGFTGEREAFILFLTLAGLIILVRSDRYSALRGLLVGLLAGFCFLIKPTAALLGPAFAILILLEPRGQIRRALLDLAAFAAGCLAPALLVAAYYGLTHHLRDLFVNLYLMNVQIYSHYPLMLEPDPAIGRFTVSRPMLLVYQLYKVLKDQPVVVLAAAAVIAGGFQGLNEKGGQKLFRAMLALVSASLLMVLIQRRPTDYHRLPLAALLAILSGGGLAWLVREAKNRTPSIRAGLSGFVLALLIASLMVSNVKPELLRFALKHAFRDLHSAYLDQTPLEQRTVDYLEANMRPGDRAYYFGRISALPFMLKNHGPVPVPEIYLMIFRFGNGSLTPEQEKWKSDYIRGFLTERPRFFILDTRYVIDYYDLPRVPELLDREFHPLKIALDRDYRPSLANSSIIIYELKTGPPPPAPAP